MSTIDRGPDRIDLIFTFTLSGMFFVASIAAVRVARLLDRTQASTVAAAEVAAALAAVESERRCFAALLHDGVMATLLAASRAGNTKAITGHAEKTLQRLDTPIGDDETHDMSVDEFFAYFYRVVREIDYTIPITTNAGSVSDTTIPRMVARTMAEAATEAVRTHPGPHAASLSSSGPTPPRSTSPIME